MKYRVLFITAVVACLSGNALAAPDCGEDRDLDCWICTKPSGGGESFIYANYESDVSDYEEDGYTCKEITSTLTGESGEEPKQAPSQPDNSGVSVW